MTVDPFTNASPHYQRAAALRSRPLPLAAGEIAELPRRTRWFRATVGALAFFIALAVLLAIRA